VQRHAQMNRTQSPTEGQRSREVGPCCDSTRDRCTMRNGKEPSTGAAPLPGSVVVTTYSAVRPPAVPAAIRWCNNRDGRGGGIEPPPSPPPRPIRLPPPLGPPRRGSSTRRSWGSGGSTSWAPPCAHRGGGGGWRRLLHHKGWAGGSGIPRLCCTPPGGGEGHFGHPQFPPSTAHPGGCAVTD